MLLYSPHKEAWKCSAIKHKGAGAEKKRNAVCVIRDLGWAGNWSWFLPAAESTGTWDIHALQALNTACKSIAFYQTLPGSPGSCHKDSAFPWAPANQSWVLNILLQGSQYAHYVCFHYKSTNRLKIIFKRVTRGEAKVLPPKGLI